MVWRKSSEMRLGGPAGGHDGASRLQNGGESRRKLPAVSGRQLSGRTKLKTC
jgi:hypothetical protein